MLSLKSPIEVLSSSKTGSIQLAHSILLPKSFFPTLPSGRGTQSACEWCQGTVLSCAPGTAGHFSPAFGLLSRGELLGQACSKSCVEGYQGMEEHHWDRWLGRGCCHPLIGCWEFCQGSYLMQAMISSAVFLFQTQFLPALPVQDSYQAIDTALRSSPSSCVYVFPKCSSGLCWAITCIIAKPHPGAHPTLRAKVLDLLWLCQACICVPATASPCP